MKTKILALIAIVVILISMGTVCFAQSSEITREYIARNIGGVESHEEKVTVDYKNLQITDDDYVKISFLDGDGLALDEYYMDLDIEDLSGLNISLNPETLAGTEYIEITIFGSNNVNNGVKLPFKIYLKMEEERS